MWTFDKKKIEVQCDTEDCSSSYSAKTEFIVFENSLYDLGWRHNKISDYCKNCVGKK